VPTKLADLMDTLGMNIPGVAERLIQREAVNYTLARCLFRVITSGRPDVTRDPFLGYYTFNWTEQTSNTGTVTLEMCVQPSGLLRLPHVESGENDNVNIQVDPYQLFGLAFDCLVDHVHCEIPTVDENAQTSGPSVIYNDDVFLKFNVPGVQ